MYLQITTRCNMSCAHCCYSCTAEGEDMSLDTLRAALSSNVNDDNISIGGGEPTIHPYFWQILGESMAAAEYVWLAINGKKTQIALALAGMAKKGAIGCELSQDEFHDDIDERVVEAFTTGREQGYRHDSHDQRGVRDVTAHKNPIKAGRCGWGDDGCVCGDLIVKPNGEVVGCGCEDAPIFGNVNNDDVIIPEGWEWGECYKQQPDEVGAA